MEQREPGLCAPGRSAGCGAGVSTGPPTMRLSITSTTGSPVELTVPRGETVEGLRARVSQKLRVHTDRMFLLHKDRQLTAGKLLDLGVADDSKLTLVPVIEAGLSTPRADRSMMDVLESLTEVQISDFLSGRSPLTINMGIGAHTMYVQLQLSAQNVAELQRKQDSKVHHSSSHNSELQHNRPSVIRTKHPGSASTSNTSASTVLDSPNSASPIHFNTSKPRIPFNSTHSTSHSSNSVHPVNCNHHSYSPLSKHAYPPHLPTYSLPSECPHPSSPLPATTPVFSNGPTGSLSGPPSPVPASTFKESNGHASSTAEFCKESGAVIESFVNHSPGVFSGTFSGTLAPHSQTEISHPRRGIAIIIQILNDLLRAACHHQGAPANLPHLHCPLSGLPPHSPQVTADEPRRTQTKPLVTQKTDPFGKTQGEESHHLHSSMEENQMLHSKLERLQFLMHQRRLRRRTRRSSRLSQASHPYRYPYSTPGQKRSSYCQSSGSSWMNKGSSSAE
ncbi:midnolin-like [Sphaeramia orbicularis]|uniref:Midnolin-like n=1 Tax=Sphaeramia orbicularis TaxID=375764 RepID=A0A673AL51_9TELE|nr:midnolin-like [Sphaeramia orbicularis]